MEIKRRYQPRDSFLIVDNDDSNMRRTSNLKGDWQNIGILFFLYTLQGIPIGLASAIPMILQNHGISYKEQAEFSFVQWPFSIKLLWAPIVDSFYSKRFGRRKSWLIPVQYFIGLFMLMTSNYVSDWMGNDGNQPNIGLLTLVFLILNFLAATQDIIVDGWALTMLKKRNVGHASTCNSVGQTTGYFLGYVLFLALESPDFCNNYLRYEPQAEGFVSLPGFLRFWGYLFIVATSIVAVFKKEVEQHDSEHDSISDSDFVTAYRSLFSILKLPPIRTLALLLLTCKIGFAPTDSVLSLKLVESGIPKEKLGLMAVPIIPLLIIFPVIISRYTSGPRPMNIYLKAIPYRLFFCFIAAILFKITPYIVHDHVIPLYYYVLLFIIFSLQQICVYCMFVSQMAFFARVSDPSVGGTYMTLLNTLSNLGGNWPQTLALWFVDPLTRRTCDGTSLLIENNLCRDDFEKKLCMDNGGSCVTVLDGFYVETVICIIIGIIWTFCCVKKINKLQTLHEDAWKLSRTRLN